MMVGLAADQGETKTVMIDAAYLKAHRAAISMGLKKEAWPPNRPDQGRHEPQAARNLRQPGASTRPLCYCGAIQPL